MALHELPQSASDCTSRPETTARDARRCDVDDGRGPRVLAQSVQYERASTSAQQYCSHHPPRAAHDPMRRFDHRGGGRAEYAAVRNRV